MSVDQISEIIYSNIRPSTRLRLLCLSGLALLSLASCRTEPAPDKPQASTQAVLSSARPIPADPPLPLKPFGSEPVPALHVLASLSSQDRSGHRRLQLYVYHPAPNEAFFWQLIKLYRSQYAVIWIYTRSQKSWSELDWEAQAAWFSPDVPQNARHPGFKPQSGHDGLVWTYAP